MTQPASFKIRVKNVVSICAKDYKEFFVDYDYLICSEAFIRRPYYVLVSDKDNYKHLTGIQSSLDSDLFFEKCYNNTLSEDEINFIKKGQSENEKKARSEGKFRYFH